MQANYDFWVDTHCHIHYEPLVSEIDEVIGRANSANIGIMVCVSTDFPDMDKIAHIMHKGHIFRSVGLHPLSTHNYSHSDIVANLANADTEGVVAVGETGLDDYREPLHPSQIPAFEAHLDFARTRNLPIIMHARGGQNSQVEIEARVLISASEVKGVAHCFGGSWEFANFLLDQGWYISFAGNITYNKTEELQQIARNIPLDKILIETDSPFLPPKKYRGKTNEPAYVVEVGKFIAGLRGISPDMVMHASTKNAYTLFGF
jgi:TatD DNase family protein